MKPSILIVVSDFPKVTETFVLSNALHYLEAGHDVSVFHLKPFRRSELVHEHTRSVVSRGFTFGWFDTKAVTGLIWAFGRPTRLGSALTKIIKAFWREPKRLAATLATVPKTCAMARQAAARNVGHIHAEFAGYPATSAWLAARLTDIPFSFSAHAHDIFLTQRLLAEKANDAAFVRSISHFNARFLSEVDSFPSDKIDVLRCGVTVGGELDLPPAPTAGAPLRIVFVGALLPRKGVDVLIRAAQLVAAEVPVTLDIIGGGSQDKMLRDLAAAHSWIIFHGPQTSEQVRTAMANAHLVVVPSREGENGRSEGIPVVIMEALSLSRPVISTRLSGIPELVEHGVTGWLCPPDEVQALAQAIREVRSDYAQAARFGAAGRARIEAEYDITKTAEALRQRIVETSQT